MAQSEKTEKATPKKKRDERKKGNVFQSKDIVSVAVIFAGFYALKFLFGFVSLRVINLFYENTALLASIPTLTPGHMQKLLLDNLAVFFMAVLPITLIIATVSIVASGAQTRFIFSMEALRPKLERLSPLKGFQRLFSLRSAIELLKSLLKIIIIVAILYNNERKHLGEYALLMNMEPAQAGTYIWDRIIGLVNTVGIAFIALSAADLLYQWFNYEKNLRMTKHEIKEEYKQVEGDPLIKSRIREKQRQMATSRMMQQVPKADVVIRNPSHFAVAIQYDREKDAAPVVLAKGMDELALRIVRVAAENGVPELEDKPLARALYDTVELGQMIPPEFYQAVAQVLAWVFSNQEKGDVNG